MPGILRPAAGPGPGEQGLPGGVLPPGQGQEGATWLGLMGDTSGEAACAAVSAAYQLREGMQLSNILENLE